MHNCCHRIGNELEDLTIKWQKLSGSIEENFETISTVLQKSNFRANELQTIEERLKMHTKEIDEIYKTIEEKIRADGKMIYHLPTKKFKALMSTGFSGLTFTIGLCAVGIEQAQDIIYISPTVKWTGLSLCLVGAISSKFSAYLWNKWGNEEANKRKLMEIKAQANIVLPNTKTVLTILKRFIHAMENDKASRRELQEIRRKTSRNIQVCKENVGTIRESLFPQVIRSLRYEAKQQGFRHSQIFDLLPYSPKIDASILESPVLEKHVSEAQPNLGKMEDIDLEKVEKSLQNQDEVKEIIDVSSTLENQSKVPEMAEEATLSEMEIVVVQ